MNERAYITTKPKHTVLGLQLKRVMRSDSRKASAAGGKRMTHAGVCVCVVTCEDVRQS